MGDLIPGITRTVYLKRIDGNPAEPLQSGATGEPGVGYQHGDLVIITDPLFGSNSYTKRSFTGGVTGIIETTNTGAIIAETDDWKFTIGAHNPIVAIDPDRDKVMYNEYNDQTDLNATHSFVFGAGVGFDTNIRFTRWIKPVLLTTGDVPYPAGVETLQLKLARLNTAFDIADTEFNTGTEAALFRGWGAQSSVLRIETGDGLITGTATSGNSTTLTDTAKTFGTDTLKNRGLQLTGGTGAGQFGLITSNTSNSINPQYGFSPAPNNTTTYEVQSATVDAANDDVDVNQGWQFEEIIARTNSENVANGQYIRRIWKADGIHTTLSKTDLTFRAGEDLLNYMHYQNYYGSNSVPMVFRAIYSDDLSATIGAPDNKRLYVTDSPILADATIVSEQLEEVWTTGNLRFRFNRGGIGSAGTYYLCSVIDADTVEHYAEFIVGTPS